MRFTALVLAVAVAASGTAHAATYDIEPLDDKGQFLGCMAINATDGVVLLAMENALSLLVTAPEFKVAKGDTVSGTWSIDTSKNRPLSDKANGASTVSIDLELTKDNFELVGNGDTLTVSIGKASHEFSLAGSSKGLDGLRACMKKAGK